MAIHKLLAGASANATSTNEVTPDISGADDDEMREVTLYGEGNFGSGTLALQASPDDGTTWVNVATITADGASHVQVVAHLLRLKLTGSTDPVLDGWVAVGAPSTEAAA
jgi:hypothetical protein